MLDFESCFRHDAPMILELHSPLDMHLHLRDGDMLKLVAPLSSASFAGAVVMPNLVPPVADAEAVQAYRGRIMDACGGDVFKPYMTAFFRSYTEKELERLRDLVFGIKLYPAGATTNSEGGVKAMKDAEATMAMMQEMGIPLLVHGETHGFVMDREAEFLDIYRNLAEQFPRLTICMEHITTAAAVRLLDEFENLAATVTLQHLLITLDDVAGGMLRPHLFCKPIAKRPEDREALLKAALSGHPRLMFGSDSAPHPVHAKEACGCAAGVLPRPSPCRAWPPCLKNTMRWTACRDLFPATRARCTDSRRPPRRCAWKGGKCWCRTLMKDTGRRWCPWKPGASSRGA